MVRNHFSEENANMTLWYSGTDKETSSFCKTPLRHYWECFVEVTFRVKSRSQFRLESTGRKTKNMVREMKRMFYNRKLLRARLT